MIPTARINPILAIRADDAQQQVKQRTKLLRRDGKRKLVNALHRRNAVADIQQLPAEGESLHVICRGNFPLYSIIPATLTLAAPATIDALTIATLGFSTSNATDLLGLIDAGQVGDVALLASVFFERQSPREWQQMADGLLSRGHATAAIRQHAKIICMALSDGRKIAVESSANLRSSRNAEFFSLHMADDLYHFHSQWIRNAISKGSSK